MPIYVPPMPNKVTTIKTLSVNNTTGFIPVFQMIGSVKVVALFAIVTTALSGNQTDAHFRLNDQTATLPLTKTTTAVMSSMPIGSMIAKRDLAANAAVVKSAAVGAIQEPTTIAQSTFTEVDVTQKTGGVATNIEYGYTTTDAPSSGAIQFYCWFIPLSADGNVIPL